jgi:hypothetical protein
VDNSQPAAGDFGFTHEAAPEEMHLIAFNNLACAILHENEP